MKANLQNEEQCQEHCNPCTMPGQCMWGDRALGYQAEVGMRMGVGMEIERWGWGWWNGYRRDGNGDGS